MTVFNTRSKKEFKNFKTLFVFTDGWPRNNGAVVSLKVERLFLLKSKL